MKILLVGLGYAGQRYLRAFIYLGKRIGIDMEFAYVSRRRKSAVQLPYFDQVETALGQFKPDIVVVGVNDHSHADILRSLATFEGFIICEKPLAAPSDQWNDLEHSLSRAKGFALDMVERYSEATRRLRNEVCSQKWSLIRSTFHWGKDRLNDYRPTCGVTSEVIHALDLLRWICPSEGALSFSNIAGTRSDFSLSGDEILDTVLLVGTLGSAPIAGYSSFVNVERQRTVDFTFAGTAGDIYHARIVYDTPAWDRDHLRIWTRNDLGQVVPIVDFKTEQRTSGLETVEKLSCLCEDVLRFVATGEPPSQPFADLTVAIDLQKRLDEISEQVLVPTSARYIRHGERVLLPEDADLESLG